MTISENDNVQQGAKTSRWALQSTFAMPPDVKMEVDDELRAAREDGDGDVEMEDETNHDDESNGVYQYTGTQGYLTIDTNVLISHLDKVQRLYEVLTSPKYQDSVSLLIPITVINELDKLKTVQYRPENPYPKYSGKVTAAARHATEWLLATQQQSGVTGHGAIRFQRWTERIDKFLRKADDKIVDCVMFFRNISGGNARLWTGDKNISLVAGSQNIQVIPSPPPPLSELLQMFGLPPLEKAVEKQLQAIVNPREIHVVIGDDDSMDIDKPLDSPIPSLSDTHSTTSPITPHTPRPFKTNNRATLAPKQHSSPSIPHTTVPSPEIIYRLTDLSSLILAALPPSPSLSISPPPIPISTNDPTRLSTQRSLNRLIDVLNLLSPTDNHLPESQDIARLIAVLIDLSKWAGPTSEILGGKGRRPLDSEAASALEVVVDILPKLGIYLDGIEEWARETTEMIKDL